MEHSEHITPTETSRPQNETPTKRRQWFWLPLLVGVFLLFAGAFALNITDPERYYAFFGSIEDTDLNQSRINAALPTPQESLSISQTFVPRHDGLKELEITLVRYGEKSAQEDGIFTIQLVNSRGVLIAEETLQTAEINHNQVYRLQFPPQTNSAGEAYQLTLQGNNSNPISAWGYSEDVYANGKLTVKKEAYLDEVPQTLVRDMQFKTRYVLGWEDALRSLLRSSLFEGGIMLLALLIFPLPGAIVMLLWQLLQEFLRRRRPNDQISWLLEPWDAAAWTGVVLALGVALWPLIWQWVTLVGGKFNGQILWIVAVVGWAAAVLLWTYLRDLIAKRSDIPALETDITKPETTEKPDRVGVVRPFQNIDLVLLGLLILGLAVRLLAVRDIIFPPWVDASRHALITAVMAQTGQAISNYAAYLPVDHFPYHYGFHSLAASLEIMSGWPLNRLLLYVGQLMNALVPLTVYAALWLLTRRRTAGLIGAFLVAIPFFFPAYYTTWGRYTQLTAVLILPVLLALTWQMLRGGKAGLKLWWLVSILAAGLFLIHFRVFVYYLPFALFAWLLNRGRNGRGLLAAGGLAILMVLPRAVELWQTSDPAAQISQNIPNYNTFPTNYFTTGWEPQFVWMAAAGLVLMLLGLFWRKTWAIFPLLLVLWVGSLFLLVAGGNLGLPETSLVNLNSMYIILFVPLALFLGILLDQIWQWVEARHWSLRTAAYVLAGFAIAAALLFGVQQQADILNEQTILAQLEDVAALNWMQTELPPNANIGVNSWQWLGETWAAGDGGAWIMPLNGHMTSTPPIDYIYNIDFFNDVRAFNQEASQIGDWADPASAAWLREQGITHVYVGKKGGFFDPAKLAANPEIKQLFSLNGAFVFEVANGQLTIDH